MTVRENLAFGLMLRKTPAAELDKRVSEAAHLLELVPLLERKPKQLSGGQRQRVAMGRAIVRNPRVFLFDEPLSNLDAALRVQMRGELQRLHQRLRSTMIYVTHDQVEAMTLATRLAVFNQGKLQQIGAPLDLYRKPANRFVAGFLGSPSMSFLPARAAGRQLIGKGFALPINADVAEQDVEVGLRPQALQIAADGPLRGEVEAVERLGAEGFVYVRTEAGPVTARFEGAAQLHVGDKVSIAADLTALHLFRASDGAAL
jgi:multiple sugar transport system ATP-binding protein